MADKPPIPTSGVVEVEDFVLERGEVLRLDGDLVIRASNSIRIDGVIIAGAPEAESPLGGVSIELRARVMIRIDGQIRAGRGLPGSAPGEPGGNGGSIILDAPLIVTAQQSFEGGSGGPGNHGAPGEPGGDGGDGGNCSVRGVIITTNGHPVLLIGGSAGHGGNGGPPDENGLPGNGGAGGNGGSARADDPYTARRAERAIIPMSFARQRNDARGERWPGAPGAHAIGGNGGSGGLGGDADLLSLDIPGGRGGDAGHGGEALGGPGENGYPGRDACEPLPPGARPLSGGNGGTGGDSGMGVGGHGGIGGRGGSGRPWGLGGRGGNGGRASNGDAGSGGDGGDGNGPGEGGLGGYSQRVIGGDGGAGHSGGNGGSAIQGKLSTYGRRGSPCNAPQAIGAPDSGAAAHQQPLGFLRAVAATQYQEMQALASMEVLAARVHPRLVATVEMADRAGPQRVAKAGQEVRVGMAPMGAAARRMVVRAGQEVTRLLALAVPEATVAGDGLLGVAVARDSPADQQSQERVGKVVTLDLASRVMILPLKGLTERREAQHKAPEARTAWSAAPLACSC